MKVLVTGCAGFIGAQLIRTIAEACPSARITGLDKAEDTYSLKRLTELQLTTKHFTFLKLNLLDDISDIMDGIDVVFHLAAKTFVDHSFRAPDSHLSNNVLGTFNLLEAMRAQQPELYIHVSTDEVYGDKKVSGYCHTEDAILKPTNPYAASKAAAEMYVQAWATAFGIPTVITRCENNYGPFQHPQKVLPTFIRSTMNGQKLPVYGDGQHKRRWIHVEDHCQALWYLVKKCEPGIFNIAAQTEISNLQLAQQVLEHMGAPSDRIAFVNDTDIRPYHDRAYGLDGSRLLSLGWAPQKDFGTELPKVINWYKQHEEWLG